ncbi:MAG TPA: glycosyltransferase family 2 protein, partial [Saprospiraceae bacterium]|nr:glycosyltransferase family 2 protein [Saprospiraceae bacterium]
VLLALVAAGFTGMLILADWWFRAVHVGHPVLYFLLSLAFWWSMIRLAVVWIGLLNIQKAPAAPTPKPGLKVAIFTTSSPGEPAEMFEKTLAACALIRYPHTTYLMDDTRDPRFREIAERHGAKWLEIVGYPGAKAGKINEALQRTSEEFILVLDPDHIPFPEFLDHSLGYFQDDRIGFVQVCQAYYNAYRSFTAAGAAEQTYTFYGPTQMALHGVGSAVAIGANCTFRRKALESIGGHGIGLAEDLITSIRLHAAGWKSIYNPVVVSRGLVPEELGSFCKQQLKWARGLFEVAFSEVPRLWRQLSFWQKLSYASISSYYFTGMTMLIFILIPFLYFITGALPAHMRIVEFLRHVSLVLLADVAIYFFIQRWLCHPEVERGMHWRGMVLKFACTPVFVLGFFLSLVNAEIPYIPTAKKAVIGSITPFAFPMLVHVIVFLLSVGAIIGYRMFFAATDELVFTAEKTWGMIGFASVAFFLSIGGLLAALEARSLKPEDPWNQLPEELLSSK